MDRVTRRLKAKVGGAGRRQASWDLRHLSSLPDQLKWAKRRDVGGGTICYCPQQDKPWFLTWSIVIVVQISFDTWAWFCPLAAAAPPPHIHTPLLRAALQWPLALLPFLHSKKKGSSAVLQGFFSVVMLLYSTTTI